MNCTYKLFMHIIFSTSSVFLCKADIIFYVKTLIITKISISTMYDTTTNDPPWLANSSTSISSLMMYLFHEKIPKSKCINTHSHQIDPWPNKALFSHWKLGPAKYIHILVIKTTHVIKANHDLKVMSFVHVILSHKNQSCHFKLGLWTLFLYTFFFVYFFIHYTPLAFYDCLSIKASCVPVKQTWFFGKHPTFRLNPSETSPVTLSICNHEKKNNCNHFQNFYKEIGLKMG